MSDAPIFIVGTERSGSNLLRLVLDAHPRITVPHPPHVMKFFDPLVAGYGDLAEEANRRALVADVVRLVRVHVHPWDFAPDEDRLVRESRTLFDVYAGLMEQARAHSGKPRWGCKSTFMIAHVPEILARFPDAKLLWLYRDPRDVAVSSRKSVFSTFHPYNTAKLWTEQQGLGLRWEAELPPERLRRVVYERLVAEPEAEIREICAFLDEAFHPDLLRHFEKPAAKRSAEFMESWGSTGKPINEDSVGKWRGQLTEREVALVEHVAGDVMERLGYARVAPAIEAPSALERARIAAEDKATWLRVEARSSRRDKNWSRRWARDAFTRWLRVRRG